MAKIKIVGEVVSFIILTIICLWFFLLNFSFPEINLTGIISGVMLLLSTLWGIASLRKYLKD